jgi:SlyX protein
MDRVEDLQVKVAFLDDLVETLNQLVIRQSQQLSDLQLQMQLLYRRVEAAQQGEGGVEAFDPLQEVPPHY